MTSMGNHGRGGIRLYGGVELNMSGVGTAIPNGARVDRCLWDTVNTAMCRQSYSQRHSKT